MLEGKLAVTVAVEKFKDNDSRRAREVLTPIVKDLCFRV